MVYNLLCLSHSASLRRIDTLSRETTLLNFFAPFWKVVYSKKKEFAPPRSKFFLLEKTPFQKGIGVQESKQEATNVCLPCKK